MAEEIKQMVLGKKHFRDIFKERGFKESFENIWRAKSALCSGVEVNLHVELPDENMYTLPKPSA